MGFLRDIVQDCRPVPAIQNKLRPMGRDMNPIPLPLEPEKPLDALPDEAASAAAPVSGHENPARTAAMATRPAPGRETGPECHVFPLPGKDDTSLTVTATRSAIAPPLPQSDAPAGETDLFTDTPSGKRPPLSETVTAPPAFFQQDGHGHAETIAMNKQGQRQRQPAALQRKQSVRQLDGKSVSLPPSGLSEALPAAPGPDNTADLEPDTAIEHSSNAADTGTDTASAIPTHQPPDIGSGPEKAEPAIPDMPDMPPISKKDIHPGHNGSGQQIPAVEKKEASTDGASLYLQPHPANRPGNTPPADSPAAPGSSRETPSQRREQWTVDGSQGQKQRRYPAGHSPNADIRAVNTLNNHFPLPPADIKDSDLSGGFPAPGREPDVHIGQIDITVEAPAGPVTAGQVPQPKQPQTCFASRYYLRRP